MSDKDSFLQVDLFLRYPLSYEQLRAQADVFDIDGVQFAVSSKRDIVPPRDKDLQDIRALEALIVEE